MAIVGQQLLTPETGWRRYDDMDSRFVYSGNGWSYGNVSSCWGSTRHRTQILNDYVEFKFYGKQIRILSSIFTDCSNNIDIEVDGSIINVSNYNVTQQYQTIIYEKLDLINGLHKIKITNKSTDVVQNILLFDAIDIDDTGYLVHPILNQKTNINDMEIGDVIPCKYRAPANTIGSFSELGTCISTEISTGGTSAPGGLFYFVKVDTGKLIADRVVQTSITWDTLNSGGYIESSKIISEKNIEFNLTSNTGALGSVISSGVWTTGYEGWRSFDSNESDFYKADSSNAGVHLGFNFNTPRIISSIVVKSGNFGGIKAQYSENGTTWIDFAVNVSGTLATGMKFILDNQPHKYFRVYMTSSSSGYPYINQIQFYEYDDPNFMGKISAISGGVSYRDSFNLPSTTNLKLGGWPIDNEWDTYIVNSDLNGKIVKGDDNIWHWSTIQSWCKETPFAGIKDLTGTATASNIHRIGRGVKDSYGNVERFSIAPSNNNSVTWGFRPVLEYKEVSSKAANLYY